MPRLLRRLSRCVAPTIALGALLVPAAASAADTPPELVTAPTVTGTVMAGSTVSCDGAVFAGTVDGTAYQWFKRGAGALAATQAYTPTRDDIGWDIYCRATATNSAGSTDADSNGQQVVDGTPNNDVAPTLTGKPTPGLAVTCSTGTWSGTGNTYSFQWLADDKPIAGATSARLLLRDAFIDKAVTCRVTATNASGSASMESKAISPWAPPILAPLAKLQPKLPNVRAAIARGFSSRLICNGTCATESHAFILATDAARLGIKGRNLGGLVIVGVGRAHRTFKGELMVTTKFSASARKGFAKVRKPLRVDLLFETSAGSTYVFNKYHVAVSETVKVRR